MTDTTTALPEAPPLTDKTCTKQQAIDHLRDFHGMPIHNFRAGTKTTKEYLLRWHDEQHKAYEVKRRREASGLSTYEQNSGYKEELTAAGCQSYLRFGFREHVHTVPVEVEDATVTEAAKKVRSNKPVGYLNASQRKALNDIVTNDFKALEHEVRSMADDARRARLVAVEEAHAAKAAEAEEYRKRLRKVLRKAAKDMERVLADAKADGFKVSVRAFEPEERANNATFSVMALAEAKKEVEKEIAADLSRGLTEVRTRFLAAQRIVLLTGVEGEVAEKVLGSIPSARDLMTLTGGGELPQIDASKSVVPDVPGSWKRMSDEEKRNHLKYNHPELDAEWAITHGGSDLDYAHKHYTAGSCSV